MSRTGRPGDPTWKGGKGKGLIGALNYLSAKGVNTFSFLPYNAGGDGDNVWPFVARNDKLHYDCSKLDQWGVVFDHATAKGLYLHFKLQENEIDDDRRGHDAHRGESRLARRRQLGPGTHAVLPRIDRTFWPRTGAELEYRRGEHPVEPREYATW